MGIHGANQDQSETLEQGKCAKENQIRERLSKLNIYKCMRLGGLHPQVLRELADMIVRPISVIFGERLVLWVNS